MPRLIRITDRCFYIPGPSNIGVVITEKNNVALIDSGADEKRASHAFELLSDYRYKITHVLNTHSHADHVAGNKFFKEKTGCKILAPKLEAQIINVPFIQAAVLFSGAPVPDLFNRFIMAAPSETSPLPEESFKIGDLEIKPLDLPGHSINQKGFLIDGTAFIADTLFPESFFQKQRFPFIYDPGAHLKTLDNLKDIKADFWIGGHFPHKQNINVMTAINKKTTLEGLDFLQKLLVKPTSHERAVKDFLDHFGLKKDKWEYYLYRATVNGYLSFLLRDGKAKYKIMDNLAVWYAIS